MSFACGSGHIDRYHQRREDATPGCRDLQSQFSLGTVIGGPPLALQEGKWP
jgi:hypothetical protein